MGYSLTIGELEVQYSREHEDNPYVCCSAKSEKHDAAPAFGEPTDHTSERWPSYGGWHDFAEFVGLEKLFFGRDERDDALIANHPGCVPLTETHRREVNAAFEAFKIRYPNAVPTYGEKQERSWQTDPNNPEENAYMCRLVWLHYWVNWAIDNCERPVFENS